jgi:hypothetical protein
MRRAIPVGALVLAFALLAPSGARAQGADQQVNQLITQAEQAYEQFLDIGSAQTYVDQAIALVRQYGVTGGSAATAYALRGVIHVWMGEESQAIEMFKSALTNNPGVSVPAAWGGPDIDAAIEKARRQLPAAMTPTCPAGTTLQPNGTCAAAYVPPPTCPAGMVLQPNGTCAAAYTPPPSCPAGMVLQPNGTCAAPYTPPPSCPAGMTLQPNGTCAPAYSAPTCPAGTTLQPNGTCAPSYAPSVPMTRHTPVTEQLWNHPVPIYLETNPSLSIGGVFLFYKTPSDIGFQRLEMARSGPGYYIEIPCTMLQPGAYDYYIMVLDPSGNPLAQEGAQDRPFHINMLQALSPGALYPTRPDGTTVNDCGPDGTGAGQECPPGFPSCHGVACERSCTFDDDCLSSETCMAGCCKVPGETGNGDEPSGPSGNIGLFLHLNVGVGLGIIGDYTAKEPRWFTGGDGLSYYGQDDYDTFGANPACQTMPPDFANPEGNRQCVPVKSGFALSGFALRVGLGYFIIPELSISANFRMSAPFGDDFPWLVEGRLHYWFLSGPNHLFGAFVGGGAGLMTHAIAKVAFNQREAACTGGVCAQSSQVYEPFYKLSGLGAIAFGATYLYMFNSLFGLGGDLGMDAMLPEFAFNIDITLQLMLSF